MGIDKKLKQFYQRKLPYESKNDNFISKKVAYRLGVSRDSVFSEIGTLLLSDGQIEYLASSIAHIFMFFISNILPSQGGLTQQAIKLLSDKLSKAEK